MEKRKYTRIVFSAKAVVEGNGASLTGKVLNLGMGGILVGAEHVDRIADGTGVVVVMMVEGKSSIINMRLHGKVLRHQKNALAIRFAIDKLEMDALVMLKTVIVSNGGDPDKIEKEFNLILEKQKQRPASG